MAGTDTPFRAAPAGDMFQKKIDELFSNMPNVFGIAYGILIAGFDEQVRTNHNKTLEKVLHVCRQVNLNLNKDNCHFRCTSIPFFVKVIL